MLSGNFMALKFGMGFLGGLHFGTDIFGEFDFCPHSIIPVTWNPEYPPGLELRFDGSPTRV